MNTPPHIILITGLPGSGKSAASDVIIQSLIKQRRTVVFRTDKQALEEEVRRDTLRFQSNPSRKLPKEGIEGDHSHLLNPDGADGSLQMVFKDGNALNTAHKQLLLEMLQFLVQKKEGDVFVIEWAYGKNVDYPGEALTHDGSQLITWLKEYGLIDQVLVLDIVSNEETRVERNSKRPGHIPTGEFSMYFPEEGHFTPDDKSVLEDRYLLIDNLGISRETYTQFIEQIRFATESFILPSLEETQTHSKEWLFIHYKER
ncbi:MAG: hypothetical protein Q8L37_06255 [Candidatus Gottesmanbacteria bacterium]|nr:hypothetical protein [Candidatus Gottesmanbacteria bacterium]